MSVPVLRSVSFRSLNSAGAVIAIIIQSASGRTAATDASPPQQEWLIRQPQHNRLTSHDTAASPSIIADWHPGLTAPVSAVSALADRPSASRPVPSDQDRLQGRRWRRFDETERAGTRSGGRKQGRNSADRCGEDRT